MSASSSTVRAATPRTPCWNGSTAMPAPPASSTAPRKCTTWCWRASCARKAAISGTGARATGCEATSPPGAAVQFDIPSRVRSWLLGRRHPFERELLHASGGLRHKDVALGIGRDVVTRAQDAGRRDRAYGREGLAIDHSNVLVGADIEELLRRIGRQRQVAREPRVGPDQLLYESAVPGEHLNPPVLPVGQIDCPVVRHADGMRDVEMHGTLGVRERLRRDDRTAV